MIELSVRALDASTWPDFADAVERNIGVWGGCWCLAFHEKPTHETTNRERKRVLVCAGKAEAALVYSGDAVVGWCQFGRTCDLPRIKNKKAYDIVATTPPDWRITCFFVDKGHRKRGVANAALSGALELISQRGGGVVEAYPEDVAGRKTSGSFLWAGTTAMFERLGFVRDRQIGKHTWVVRIDARAA